MIFLFCCFGPRLSAQTVPPLVIDGKQPPYLDISPYTEFYEDKSGDTLPFSAIRKQAFLPFSQKRNERTTNADHPLLVTWLRFRIRNANLTDTLRLFYDCWQGKFITVYENNRPIAYGGVGRPRRKGAPNTSAVLLRIPPGQQHVYYVESVSQIMSVLPIVSRLYQPEEAYKRTLENAYLESPLLLVWP